MNLRSSTSTFVCLIFFTILTKSILFSQEFCDPNLIESIVITPTSCGNNDGTISIDLDSTLLGNFDFEWSDTSFGDVSTITGLSAGFYSVILDRGQNEECILADDLEVGESETLSVACTEQIDIQFLPSNNRKIRVAIGNGTGPYFVEWSGPLSGDFAVQGNDTIISNLISGDYQIKVTDSNNCEGNCEKTLDCPAVIVLTEIIPPSCAEGNDGSIAVNAFGHSNITWSNNVSGTLLLGSLSAGTYGVTVTADDGCQKSIENIVVPNPSPIKVRIDTTLGDKSRDPGFNTGEAPIQISGGAPPYSIEYQGLSTSNPTSSGNQSGIFNFENLTNLAYGEYSLKVRDSENCTYDTTFFIYDVFVIPPGEKFILDFWDNSTQVFYDSVQMALKEKADKLDSCDCVGGIERLQLWEAKEELELHSNGEGSGGKTKGDTSGLAQMLLPPTKPLDELIDDQCVDAPAIPNPNVPKIQVAIIDSGSNLDSDLNPEGHTSLPDLTWSNLGEPLPLNKEDSDENCHVDDREGFDHVNLKFPVVDLDGHGTHIAGIVADGYPKDVDLEIINLKVFEEGNEKSGVFALSCAIHYAVNNGADVINLSLGYKYPKYSEPLYRALQRAEKAGIIVVVSAGNEGENLDPVSRIPGIEIDYRWPVRFKKPFEVGTDSTLKPLSNMLVVAGLDLVDSDDPNADLDLKNSNYGPESVDLAARAVFSGPILNNDFATYRGTSMAAGGLTRLLSIIRAKRPDLSPNEIITELHKSAASINSGHLLISAGKLNADMVLESFGIDPDSVYKKAVKLPGINDIGWPANWKLTIDGFEIPLNRLNDLLLYDDVHFRVYNAETDDTFYERYFCSTNIIPWDGNDDNGNRLPQSGEYRMEISIGDATYSSQKIVVE